MAMENTAGEKQIEAVLKKHRVRSEGKHRLTSLKKDSKKYRIPDFYLPEYRLCIEYFGSWDLPGKSLQARERLRFLEKVAVYELNKQLEGVFTIALESYEGTKGGWAFSVSFAIRALLNQGPTEQVDPTLKEILLGSEEDPFPRKDLPAEILPEIDTFVSLVGRSLTADEQEEMASLALAIYTFLNP